MWISFAFLFPVVSFASDSPSLFNNIRLGGNINHGTILPHHSSIDYALNSNISGFDIDLTVDTYGHSAWDRLYRFPRLGLAYNYTSLGNKDVYGSAHAISAFVMVPILANPAWFNFYYQISFGFAFLTRSFDIENNPINMAISSAFNAYANLQFTGRFAINNHNEIMAGCGFHHFSNGKMGTPNQGLNSLSLSLGYFYKLKSTKQYERLGPTTPAFKKHNFDLVLSAGLKADDQASNSKYLISSIVVDYKFNPGPKYAFGMGCDFFYDQTLGPDVAEEEGDEYSQSDLLQFGMHFGLYARYGKFQIIGHVGTYLYAEYYKYSTVYTRIGVRYSIYKNVFFNMSLKAHYAIADYVEWGIGYRF